MHFLLLVYNVISKYFFNPNYIILVPLAQSPSFISEMVVDQRSISVPIKEEPGLNFKSDLTNLKINFNFLLYRK
jgi:hypothetical protein